MMSNFTDRRVTRRHFSLTAGCALVGSVFADACGAETKSGPGSDARLASRPHTGVTTTIKSGALGLATGRDATLQLPSAPSSGPLPLLLLLHGAGQSGATMLRRVGAAADEAGVAVLAPDSRSTTWDAIREGFGDDVTFLDRALEHVFARASIDPARVTVGGFSDGASYALSLGLANGDVFPRVLAFSPGFVISATVHGRFAEDRTEHDDEHRGFRAGFVFIARARVLRTIVLAWVALEQDVIRVVRRPRNDLQLRQDFELTVRGRLERGRFCAAIGWCHQLGQLPEHRIVVASLSQSRIALDDLPSRRVGSGTRVQLRFDCACRHRTEHTYEVEDNCSGASHCRPHGVDVRLCR
jgi:pimeloyl-ACP methyl ester carboxylesterase